MLVYPLVFMVTTSNAWLKRMTPWVRVCSFMRHPHSSTRVHLVHKCPHASWWQTRMIALTGYMIRWRNVRRSQSGLVASVFMYTTSGRTNLILEARMGHRMGSSPCFACITRLPDMSIRLVEERVRLVTSSRGGHSRFHPKFVSIEVTKRDVEICFPLCGFWLVHEACGRGWKPHLFCGQGKGLSDVYGKSLKNSMKDMREKVWRIRLFHRNIWKVSLSIRRNWYTVHVVQGCVQWKIQPKEPRYDQILQLVLRNSGTHGQRWNFLCDLASVLTKFVNEGRWIWLRGSSCLKMITRRPGDDRILSDRHGEAFKHATCHWYRCSRSRRRVHSVQRTIRFRKIKRDEPTHLWNHLSRVTRIELWTRRQIWCIRDIWRVSIQSGYLTVRHVGRTETFG